MRRMPTFIVALPKAVIVFALVVCFITPLYAQAPQPAPPPLHTYAISHLFALPNATTTRLAGMGGFFTCIEDKGFANPAFAGTLEKAQAVGRISRTDTSSGLELTGSQFSFALPLSDDGRGVQVTRFSLGSDAATLQINGQQAVVDIDERDLSVHYGQRYDEKWVFGIAGSPQLETDTIFSNPADGSQIAKIHGKADFGYRLGALRQLEGGGWAGLVYDRYEEDVTGSGALYGEGMSASFISEGWGLGISRPLTDEVMAAIEWQQLESKGAGVKVGDSGIRVGFEAQVGPWWAVRAGSNDGSLSAGAEFDNGKYSFEYAYIDDWNEDAAGAYLGGSTTHQFAIRAIW
ncbi:MAG: hypothetical protein ACLFWB_14005 [Armatimonadota bacterium]